MHKQDPPIQFRDKHLTAALAKRAADGESLGLVTQRVVHRYLTVCRAACPTLSEGQWCAIFDALKDTWAEDVHHPRSVHTAVQRAARLGAKWNIDQDALVARLKGMNVAARCAVLDAVEQFWAGAWPAEGGYREIIVAIVGEDHITED